MTYGLGTSLFIENGPAVLAATTRSRTSTARNWRALGADTRLRLVERALRPANHGGDGYPVAL